MYSEVLKFWEAVTAILATPALRGDRNLHGQTERAISSVDANLKEGFEAPSDAAFANFVFTAKGSTEARRKNHITEAELGPS